MYFRRERKYEEAISLDQPIEEDDWGKSFTLGCAYSRSEMLQKAKPLFLGGEKLENISIKEIMRSKEEK